MRLTQLLFDTKDNIELTIRVYTKVIHKDYFNNEFNTFTGKPSMIREKVLRFRGLAALDPEVFDIHTDGNTFVECTVRSVNRYCDN